jgi:CARDB
MARPGEATGKCAAYEPSLTSGVRNLELNYHALVSVWWEGRSTARPDLVPTLTDACHAKFTVRNAGSAATPATTATVTGAAGATVVAVPALKPGQSVDLGPPNVLECEGDVTVVVDPDHSIPDERFDNNTVKAACIC